MRKVGYIFGWLIIAPLVIITGTIVCPFALTTLLFLAAKNGWPKPSLKIKNLGLTPPLKEVINLN